MYVEIFGLRVEPLKISLYRKIMDRNIGLELIRAVNCNKKGVVYEPEIFSYFLRLIPIRVEYAYNYMYKISLTIMFIVC